MRLRSNILIFHLFFFLVAGVWLFPLDACHAGYVDHFAVKDDVGKFKVPRFGDSNVLVVPVNLDTRRRERINPEKFKHFYDSAQPGVNFEEYFTVASGGRYRPRPLVMKPVEWENCPLLPYQQARCTPERRDPTAIFTAQRLVRDILQRIDERGFDFRRIDRNGPGGKPDGWADGVVIVTNMDWFGIAFPFGLIAEEISDSPEDIPSFDGVRVGAVAISAGPRALRMSIHEFGHLLGLADLYDEWRRTYGGAFSPMGGWRYWNSPPVFDAFSRYQMGWGDPVQVEGCRRVTIPPAAATGKLYRLGVGKEYFLVENRHVTGNYDGQFQEPGLAIYQVNLGRLPQKTSNNLAFVEHVVNCPNCDPWKPLVRNVQADRRHDLQHRDRGIRGENRDLFRTGDALLPLPRRLPRGYTNEYCASNDASGRPTGISVTDIDSDSQWPNVIATFCAPYLEDACADLACPPDSRCLEGSCVPIFDAEDFDTFAGIPLSSRTRNVPADIPTSWLRNVTGSLVGYSLPQGNSLGCQSAELGCEEPVLDWRLLSFVPLIVWLLMRRRLRDAYERRKDEEENSHKGD